MLTKLEDVLPYSFDGTAALRQRPAPSCSRAPVEDVAGCVKLAAAHSVPIVTRGSGTGLSGGSVPQSDSLVLCLAQMNAIVDVDPRNLTLRAQAGAITQTIDEAAAVHGLFYPPDPGSMRISTIGGNVAENSGGLRGLKYGVTRDYVMALEVVLADGQIARLGSPCVKDVAGYSMKDLFIGSEGTLGIITEVLLQARPAPGGAADHARDLRTHRGRRRDGVGDHRREHHPLHARVPGSGDGALRRRVRARRPADRLRGGAADGNRRPPRRRGGRSGARWRRSPASHRAREVRVARDEAEALALASARRNAFAALARRRPTTISRGLTVPRSELATMVELHRRDRARLRPAESGRSATWGTATCTRRS